MRPKVKALNFVSVFVMRWPASTVVFCKNPKWGLIVDVEPTNMLNTLACCVQLPVLLFG